jgi:decaprenyl-phosphate phosphoribosyltransferase
MEEVKTAAPAQPDPAAPIKGRATLGGHIAIMRIDHWFKNVFVLPGIVAAIGVDPGHIAPGIWLRVVIGLASICLVASSNYVVNEVLDAPSDRSHPVKYKRPVPSGKVNVPLAYVEWLVLMVVGVGLGSLINTPFMYTVFALWVMGCIYNIRPVRSKDLPYLDVLSEAVNNPIRMLAGWFIVGTASVAPASLLASYWMIGCYFMAMKRFAEFRDIGDPARAAAYRKSFAFYTEERLLVSIMFYGSSAMLFLGAFAFRYRFELVLAFPLVSLVMAIYLLLAFRKDSAVQRPEGLYKEPALMAAVVVCAIVTCTALLVDIPMLNDIFNPTAPTIGQRR